MPLGADHLHPPGFGSPRYLLSHGSHSQNPQGGAGQFVTHRLPPDPPIAIAHRLSHPPGSWPSSKREGVLRHRRSVGAPPRGQADAGLLQLLPRIAVATRGDRLDPAKTEAQRHSSVQMKLTRISDRGSSQGSRSSPPGPAGRSPPLPGPWPGCPARPKGDRDEAPPGANRSSAMMES